MAALRKGDRVKVMDVPERFGGLVGTVIRVNESDHITYDVKLDHIESPFAGGTYEFLPGVLEKYSPTTAIQDLLKRTAEYPRQSHGPLGGEVTGFQYSRDELVAMLQECSPLISIGVNEIRHWPGGDETSVRITVYATFSRSELDIEDRVDSSKTRG